MYFKLAIVLLSMVAVSQAGYFVINTWADENCNTTLVAKYITNLDEPCWPTKRSVSGMSVSDCVPSKDLQALFSVDYSFCESRVAPELPEGWQSIRLGSPGCTFNESTFGEIAAESLDNAPIVALFETSYVLANTTLSCNTGNGVLSFSSCTEGVPCLEYSLENGVCLGDSASNNTFGLQTSCVAAPVAPVAAPVAESPVAAPGTTAPVKAPVKAPSATSAAPETAIFGSVAVLAVSIFAVL